MRPQTISITPASGTTSGWVPFDLYVTSSTNVQWATYITAPATYDIEGTISDVWTSGATIVTFKMTGATGLNANSSGVVTNPISAIRLFGTAGTGAVTLVVRQQAAGV